MVWSIEGLQKRVCALSHDTMPSRRRPARIGTPLRRSESAVTSLTPRSSHSIASAGAEEAATQVHTQLAERHQVLQVRHNMPHLYEVAEDTLMTEHWLGCLVQCRCQRPPDGGSDDASR